MELVRIGEAVRPAAAHDHRGGRAAPTKSVTDENPRSPMSGLSTQQIFGIHTTNGREPRGMNGSTPAHDVSCVIRGRRTASRPHRRGTI